MRADGFKVEKLIKNLRLVAQRIDDEDLPITIKELYVFGSILRKNRPRDIDVVAIYGMDDKQNEKWDNFCENIGKELREFGRFPQDIPFSDVVANNLEYFTGREIEPNWVSCFSWSDLQNFEWNPFAINWQTVVTRRLTKGVKGVHIQFRESLNYFKSPERFLLAWSPERSDIQLNLTATEPRLRVLAAENELLRKELQEANEKLEVFTTLYENTRELIKELTNVLKQDVYGHKFDDVLTLRTLLFVPKRKVKEDRIREILKELGLPADKVEKIPRSYNIKKA